MHGLWLVLADKLFDVFEIEVVMNMCAVHECFHGEFHISMHVCNASTMEMDFVKIDSE
jgi:hypothetical protein